MQRAPLTVSAVGEAFTRISAQLKRRCFDMLAFAVPEQVDVCADISNVFLQLSHFQVGFRSISPCLVQRNLIAATIEAAKVPAERQRSASSHACKTRSTCSSAVPATHGARHNQIHTPAILTSRIAESKQRPSKCLVSLHAPCYAQKRNVSEVLAQEKETIGCARHKQLATMMMSGERPLVRLNSTCATLDAVRAVRAGI